MCEPCTPAALIEAVRGLRIADPDLGMKPLLAKLREQQPDLGAGTKEVREALRILKAESEAKESAAPSERLAQPCWGCAKHAAFGEGPFRRCGLCLELKLASPASFCSEACQAEHWPQHRAWHKLQKKRSKEVAECVARDPDGQALLERDLRQLEVTAADKGGDKIAEKIASKIQMEQLRQMAADRPRDAEAQRLMRQLEESIKSEAATRSARGDPEVAKVMATAGKCHQRGSYSKAAKVLTKGIAEHQGHPMLHYLHSMLATVYRDSGDVSRAAENYVRTADLTKAAQNKDDAVAWAKAAFLAWSALSALNTPDEKLPPWLQGDQFALTSLKVLAVQVSRTPDETDAHNDLFDANCMRATALAFTTNPADVSEYLKCCESASVLARDPSQQAVANSLRAARSTVIEQPTATRDTMFDRLHAAGSMTDEMLKKVKLREESVRR